MTPAWAWSYGPSLCENAAWLIYFGNAGWHLARKLVQPHSGSGAKRGMAGALGAALCQTNSGTRPWRLKGDAGARQKKYYIFWGLGTDTSSLPQEGKAASQRAEARSHGRAGARRITALAHSRCSMTSMRCRRWGVHHGGGLRPLAGDPPEHCGGGRRRMRSSDSDHTCCPDSDHARSGPRSVHALCPFPANTRHILSTSSVQTRLGEGYFLDVWRGFRRESVHPETCGAAESILLVLRRWGLSEAVMSRYR